MPKQDWSVITQRSMLGYVGLARGKICIRAVHHVFNPENELEETEDEGEPHARHRLIVNGFVVIAQP